MNRRTFVKALGPPILFSGCLATSNTPGDQTESATNGTTDQSVSKNTTATSMPSSEHVDIKRMITITDRAIQSSNGAVKFGVSVTKAQIIISHTAQLVLSLENTTNHRLSVSPFPQALVPDKAKGIALRRGDQTPPPTCSKDADGIGIPAIAEPPQTIKPNGAATQSYYVIDDPTGEDCYATGTYTFTTQFKRQGKHSSSKPYTLSFDVKVTSN